jgi:hypothetical protein
MTNPKPCIGSGGWLNSVDAMTGTNSHSKLATTLDERIENGPSFVGHRKQFAGLFAFEIDPQRGKPCNRLLDGKRGQHILDDPAIAEEIGWGHDLVRDIAAPPAGHENFGADGVRAVENDNPSRLSQSGRLTGKDPGGQPGSPGSNDRDIHWGDVFLLHHVGGVMRGRRRQGSA